MFGAEVQKEQPTNPAKGPMDSVFQADAKDKPETEYKAEPFTEQELDQKVGKPRKELKGGEKQKFADLIAQAKDMLKTASADHKVSHGDTQGFDVDDTGFVYLRDDTQKPDANKDRLFKRA
jgi:hypothetical protein